MDGKRKGLKHRDETRPRSGGSPSAKGGENHREFPGLKMTRFEETNEQHI
jgi:hypothetical protein